MITVPRVRITHPRGVFLRQCPARVFSCLLLGLAIRAVAEDPPCVADPLWLPATPVPTFAGPPPPHPKPDCPFYRAAWQTFLYVTQPDEHSFPAFLSYPTIQKTLGSGAIKNFPLARVGFLSLAPRTIQTPNGPPPPKGTPRLGGGVTQAGLRGILIDQVGQPIYYAIHMNETFAKFLRDNNLITSPGILNAPADLEFAKGCVELKSAWKVVSTASPPADYFIAQAEVPRLVVLNNELVVDKMAAPKPVTVALLAIHVVFVLQGHPEFIWSTFEHVNADGKPDIAPLAPGNPPVAGDPPIPTDGINYVLFKTGTTYLQANVLPTPTAYIAGFDPQTQTFTKGGILQTPIMRVFPAAKSGTTTPDGEVEEINASILNSYIRSTAQGEINDLMQSSSQAFLKVLVQEDSTLGKFLSLLPTIVPNAIIREFATLQH